MIESERSVKLNKLLTLAVFLVYVGIGTYILFSNPTVTGLATQEASSCSLDVKNTVTVFSGDALPCEVTDKGIELTNNFVPVRAITVKSISVGDCTIKQEVKISSSKEIAVDCPLKRNNELSITYIDLQSNIEYTTKGSLRFGRQI